MIKQEYIGKIVYCKKLDRNILIDANGNYKNLGLDFIYDSNKQEQQQSIGVKYKRKGNNNKS